MIRADSTAPVFNDEEKRARATTQVHKVARDGYRCDPAGLAFWAGCDGSTTRVAGARHVGSFPHGMCQLSHKRFAPSCGASGPGCKAEVVGSDPFRQLWGITHGPARGQGAYILYGTKLATAAPSFACRRRLEIRGWGGSRSLEAGSGTASRCRATFWTKDA